MIQITQREHLLHCVVPAATVRMQEEATGMEDRAVPAEIAALEAALSIVTKEWPRALASGDRPMSHWAGMCETALREIIYLKRRRDAIGGNDGAERRLGEKL